MWYNLGSIFYDKGMAAMPLRDFGHGSSGARPDDVPAHSQRRRNAEKFSASRGEQRLELDTPRDSSIPDFRAIFREKIEEVIIDSPKLNALFKEYWRECKNGDYRNFTLLEAALLKKVITYKDLGITRAEFNAVVGNLRFKGYLEESRAGDFFHFEELYYAFAQGLTYEEIGTSKEEITDLFNKFSAQSSK